MLNGIRFMVNWFVEVRFIKNVSIPNGSSVPCFNYKAMDQP